MRTILGAYASIATKLPLRSSSASGSATAVPLTTRSAAKILSCSVIVWSRVIGVESLDRIDDCANHARVDGSAGRAIEQAHLVIICVAVVPVDRHQPVLVSGPGDVLVPIDTVPLGAVVLRSQHCAVLAHDHRHTEPIDEPGLHLLELRIGPGLVPPGLGDRRARGNRSPLPDAALVVD